MFFCLFFPFPLVIASYVMTTSQVRFLMIFQVLRRFPCFTACFFFLMIFRMKAMKARK